MSHKEPFRTPTGQTGKDAYVYELSAIRNSLRDLERRFAALGETIARETPDGATAEHEIGGRAFPIDAETIRTLARFDAQDLALLNDLTALVNTLKLPAAAPAAPAPAEQRVTIVGPNLRDQSKGDFVVHAEGCADIAKMARRDPAYRDGWTIATQDFRTIVESVYEDMIDEDTAWTAFTGDIHLAPCCSKLPREATS